METGETGEPAGLYLQKLMKIKRLLERNDNNGAPFTVIVGKCQFINVLTSAGFSAEEAEKRWDELDKKPLEEV